MALRAVPAKGLAIGAIGGTFAAAAILLGWPEAPVGPDARTPVAPSSAPLIASRAITIDIVNLPLAKRQPATRLLAVRSAEAVPPPIPIAVDSQDPMPDTPTARSVEEPPLLVSRSSAFASDLPRLSSMSVDAKEPSRQDALTRAMGTTAGAFRTAGSSVAGALKKVFE
jgi:hypothetical protein